MLALSRRAGIFVLTGLATPWYFRYPGSSAKPKR
jgi:hypothetical protein